MGRGYQKSIIYMHDITCAGVLMEIGHLISRLEEIAPPALAEDFDCGRIGLIVRGSPDVRKIATALDPTAYAIGQAIEAGAQMLVTHHTLIWDPVNLIDEGLALRLKLLLDSGLSLYSMHTNYDYAPDGVNDVLAGLLGLTGVCTFEHARVGDVPETSLREFALLVSEKLRCPVEYVGEGDRPVKRIALVAGSGFRPGLEPAKQAGADVLLSSELKHDVIRDRGDVALASAPHYHTEAPAMAALADRLNEFIPAGFIEDSPGIKVIDAVEREAVGRV